MERRLELLAKVNLAFDKFFFQGIFFKIRSERIRFVCPYFSILCLHVLTWFSNRKLKRQKSFQRMRWKQELTVIHKCDQFQNIKPKYKKEIVEIETKEHRGALRIVLLCRKLKKWTITVEIYPTLWFQNLSLSKTKKPLLEIYAVHELLFEYLNLSVYKICTPFMCMYIQEL